MELVEEHLKELKKYLDVWKRYKKEVKFWDFYENIDVQNMVLHCMFVAIQSAIDVANDIIVMKNLEEPSTYKESFEILRKKQNNFGSFSQESNGAGRIQKYYSLSLF